jgi:hypothetical protein
MLDHFASSEDAGGLSSVTASDETAPSAEPGPASSASSATEETDSTTAVNQLPAAPHNFEQYRTFVEVTCAAATNAAQLREWYQSAEQRKLRNECNIVAEEKATLDGIVKKRINELSK